MKGSVEEIINKVNVQAKKLLEDGSVVSECNRNYVSKYLAASDLIEGLSLQERLIFLTNCLPMLPEELAKKLKDAIRPQMTTILASLAKTKENGQQG